MQPCSTAGPQDSDVPIGYNSCRHHASIDLQLPPGLRLLVISDFSPRPFPRPTVKPLVSPLIAEVWLSSACGVSRGWGRGEQTVCGSPSRPRKARRARALPSTDWTPESHPSGRSGSWDSCVLSFNNRDTSASSNVNEVEMLQDTLACMTLGDQQDFHGWEALAGNVGNNISAASYNCSAICVGTQLSLVPTMSESR